MDRALTDISPLVVFFVVGYSNILFGDLPWIFRCASFRQIRRLITHVALTHDDIELVSMNDPFISIDYMACFVEAFCHYFLGLSMGLRIFFVLKTYWMRLRGLFVNLVDIRAGFGK